MVYDRDDRPVHTSLEYQCRDRWGLLTTSEAREPVPAEAATDAA